MGDWPVYHLPGNHDVAPGPLGGTGEWRRTIGTMTPSDSVTEDTSYRELLQPGWQLLLLDSMSELEIDRGGGQIGETQLRWLERKLTESSTDGRSVILMTHQVKRIFVP